ncbi:MAG: Transcriptional activatory protein BadR [Herbaspirillum frisingense]|uniref:Transcriptional activatory protein BadR n=1 Tax=Herbaspirillum frisingense TaxID=92645 RepID=A0A7V8FX69_9BURK|nr:MAG: Transcriptional activatory protein BadR [Herbaspirillum frisingense]
MSSTTDLASPSNPMPLIGQINRAFARATEQPLKQLGFAMSQVPVLVTLKRNGLSSQADLARAAQVEQPSMAQLLNRMERDGLMQRVPNPQDGRSQLISLTPLASARMPKGKAVMDAMCGKALAGFSDQEQEQLHAFLQRVLDNLQAVNQEQAG